MAIPLITKLPPAPQRTDPANFPAKGDAMMSALDPMVTQINAAIDGLNTVEAEIVKAQEAATSATAAAGVAQSVAGATLWVSGRTYAPGTAAISLVNFQTYRKRTASSSTTTDPANDSVNWRIIASGSNTFVPVVVADGSIDLRLGSFFTKTINGNTTLSIDNCPPDGVTFTLELTVVSGAVTFAQASAIKTSYDRPVTLAAGKTHELMFITTNGGSRWKLAVGESFTT